MANPLLPVPDTRPHLLFFNPDQWRGGALGHLGDPAAHTPNVDALAREGVSFRQAYCQNPVCTPSRCSFMTGWYPHTRGHRTIHHMLGLERGENNLLKALKGAGYFVFWAGKNDLVAGQDDVTRHCDVYFQPTEADYARWGLTRRAESHAEIQSRRGAPGDDTYYSFFGGKLETGDDPLYLDSDWANVLGAAEFVRNYDGERPLCVFLPLLYPHPPFLVEEPWFSAVDRASVPARVPSPSDEQLDRLPRAMRGLQEGLGMTTWSEARWTELRAVYYGMIARVDEQFGRVRDAFVERGIYDQTATFFFSDHGEYAGDYGLVEKAQNLFQDALTRVPFVFRPPADTPCRPRVSDALVELVDFPATVCSLPGVDLGHRQFGRSLLPLLADEDVPWRDAVFCEGGRLPGEVEASEAFSNSAPAGLHEPSELYDLVSDSTEVDNRIDDPALAAVRRDLETRLLRWMIATADIVPREPDQRAFRI